MRQLSRVTMSMRELDRLKCVQAVIDGAWRATLAAERLGMSPPTGASSDLAVTARGSGRLNQRRETEKMAPSRWIAYPAHSRIRPLLSLHSMPGTALFSTDGTRVLRRLCRRP